MGYFSIMADKEHGILVEDRCPVEEWICKDYGEIIYNIEMVKPGAAIIALTACLNIVNLTKDAAPETETVSATSEAV